jgi:hypothetical protein
MKKNLLLTALAALTISLSSCGQGNMNEAQKYSKDLEYQDNFRILWLTDLHWGSEVISLEKEKSHLDKMIKEAGKVNLLILTGDSFLGETLADIDDFVSFLDSYAIPWTLVDGNHDSKTLKDSAPYYINKKASEAKNSVFVDYEDDDISGRMNFFINLKNADKKTVYRLYLLDSNADYEGGGYDIIHPDQLQHFERCEKLFGDESPVLAFYHIPLYQYVYAYDGFKKSKYPGQGVNNENCCVGYKDSGAYAYFSKYHVIGSFCGHDHLNYSDVFYNNQMILSYGLKGSDLDYHDDSLIGYKIISLPSDSAEFGLGSIETHFCLY